MHDSAAVTATRSASVSMLARLRPWLLGGQGRPAALMLALLLACGQALWGEAVWQPVRLRVFDAYQRFFPRYVAQPPVVIIDIDEASLKAFGQWPWPRTRLAQLITATQQLGARAIGLDLILSEADRLSPQHVLREQQELPPALQAAFDHVPSHDAVLAEAIRSAQVVVVGRAALGKGASSLVSLATQPPIRLFGELPKDLFPQHYPAHLTSLPSLEAAAAGHGYLNNVPDPDGVVREASLVLALYDTTADPPEGIVAPTLALELLRVATASDSYSVYAEASGIQRLQIGTHPPLLTEPNGRFRPHFAPTDDAWRQAWLVSAQEVLEQRAAPEAVRGKIALIGVTALGLADIVTTPVAARMDGVMVQAQVLENLLQGVQLRRPSSLCWWELALFLLGAAGLVAFFPGAPPAQGGTIGLASAGMIALGSAGLFVTWQLLFDPSFALGGNLLIFVVLLTSNLTASQQARRALQATLEAEKLRRSRLEGELEAAQKIQMGLLPTADTMADFPPHIAFHALLHPAKTVGGDLYDAFMLDAEHLFFLVGDVSGKGVPAALFMARGQTLCQSLALRVSLPLPQLVTLLNQEMARHNAELLFVTAIAGILNVQTGAVALCSAGHEAPILLRRGAPPRVLEVNGGPPLCILDTFDYPGSVLQLQPGDLLLLMTDGVSEAQDRFQTLYGAARILAYCQRVQDAAAACEARAVCQGLYDDVQAFIDHAEPFDDIAIVALQFTAPPTATAGPS